MPNPTTRFIVGFLFFLVPGLLFFHGGSVSAQTDQPVQVIQLSASGFEQAHALAFSSDGKILAVGGTSGIYLFDSQKLSSPNFIKTDVWAHSLAFEPDSNELAAGLFDNTIKFWDLPQRNLIKTLDGHQDWVRSISFSKDGRLLASASDDNTVRIWNVADSSLALILNADTIGVRAVALSPNGTLIAAALEDKTLRVWQVEDGKLLSTLHGHTDWVRCLTFSPDGSLLASGSFDKTVRVWDVANGTLLKTLEGHNSSVLGVAFSPDGQTLASGSVDRTVRLWSVSNGAPLNILQGHTDFVYSVAFSPNGKTLASGGADNAVRLWDLENLPAESASDQVQLPATPSDCRACHHSRGQGQPPRVIELRCEGCHTNGASLNWCPAFLRSPEAITPPVSYSPYYGHSGVPIGGSDVSVLISSPSNGETLYARSGITAAAFVVGQVHAADADMKDVQVQLSVWSGDQQTATLHIAPSPTGQFKFNLSINPQGGIPYIIKPGGADCVPCHEDFRPQAPMPNGDVQLVVTVSGPDGIRASDERWIKVDSSKTITLPVEIVDALTNQPLPGLPIRANAVFYEWRSGFGHGMTEQNGVAQIALNQLTQAPTLYSVSIPPTVYQGKLYSSDEPVSVSLTPDETSYSTVTLTARAQTGQLTGYVTRNDLGGIPSGTKIWVVQLPAGPSYSANLDAENGFSLPQIPVGRYLVLPDPNLLLGSGLSARGQSVNLSDSPQSSTVINLEKSDSISGTVSSFDGEALPFAWLTVNGNSKAFSTSPFSGTFLISELTANVKSVSVSAPGYFSRAQHLTDTSQPLNFQLEVQPETQRLAWGNGSLIVPPETEATINALAVNLDQGWLWGNGGASQPLVITLPFAQISMLNADFAIEYPAEGTGWLYVHKGDAQLVFDGEPAPVEVGSGQMIALVSGAQPIPMEEAVITALHPALASVPILEIVKPSPGTQLQNWLEKAGIGIAQIVTFITYILSLVALFTIPLIGLFSSWKKRRSLSSFEEKH